MVLDGYSSSHPPLPPISEEDHLTLLRLLRSRRVGAVTFHRLLKEHGSAQAALEALPGIARAAGETSYQVCPEGVVMAELREARRAGARPIWFGSPDYPSRLAGIHDAPPLLWARGTLKIDEKTSIAVVGARNASSLGTRMTRRLARDMGAAGLHIASGLARGVDTVAHAASVETGTIAVVAGGVDVPYPTENATLMAEIAEKGIILSEMPPGIHPQARHFPRRNRIISGLSKAVVVVEAAAKSGSLITAEMAADQGRDVLAVPGHPFDARAGGCLKLLRDGAVLVRGVEDVLEAIGEPGLALPEKSLAGPKPASRPLRETAKLHQQVLDRLGPSPMAEDQLIRDFDAPAAQVSSALVDLEMDGQIERQQGGLLSRKSA